MTNLHNVSSKRDGDFTDPPFHPVKNRDKRTRKMGRAEKLVTSQIRKDMGIDLRNTRGVELKALVPPTRGRQKENLKGVDLIVVIAGIADELKRVYNVSSSFQRLKTVIDNEKATVADLVATVKTLVSERTNTK